MKYLDIEQLRALPTDEFMSVTPYPYLNKPLLHHEGFQVLLDNMPPLEMFDAIMGKSRRAGQAPHDRHSLEYTPGMPVPKPWQDFIGELCSDAYRGEIQRLLGARKVEFRFHWHYTPNGADVSPHCDARREHGSHLFYFNSKDSWDPAWGGATLALDDGGQLDYNTAPVLEDFDEIIEFESIGNASALMLRTDHSWHAVRPIACPDDKLRKVFIVVINPDSLFWKIRDRIIGKTIQRF